MQSNNILTLINKNKFFIISFCIWFLFFSTSFFVDTSLFFNSKSYVVNSSKSVYDNLYLIISTNIVVTLQILSGFFLLGLSTFVLISYNGFHFGITLNYLLFVKKINISIILTYSISHFSELVALWLAGSIGFQGISIFYILLKKNELPNNIKLIKCLKISVISIVIIIVSGFLEVFISSRLI